METARRHSLDMPYKDKEKERERSKLYRTANRERILKKNKERYGKIKSDPKLHAALLERARRYSKTYVPSSAARERAKAADLARHRKRFARDPDYWRASHMRRKFGLSLTEVASMWERQDGNCLACGEAMVRRGRSANAASVDHCHIKGTIRGLLHNSCNVAAGLIYHDARRARLLADYLERTNAAPTLELRRVELDAPTIDEARQMELWNADHAANASTDWLGY